MSLRVAGLYSRSIKAQCRAPTQSTFQALPKSPCSTGTRFLHQPSKSIRTKTIPNQPPRRFIQNQRFQAFAPPSPESLGKAAPAKEYRRTIKWGKRLLFVSAVTGIAYLVDTQFYASSITRSLRTFGLGVVVACDYKLNFRPEPWTGGTIEDLHRRNAERLFALLHQNGGLYLKIGQAIAMQSAVLPPEFQKMFARMFDDAPQNEWADVEKVGIIPWYLGSIADSMGR